jgi:hypothetical protein
MLHNLVAFRSFRAAVSGRYKTPNGYLARILALNLAHFLLALPAGDGMQKLSRRAVSLRDH